MRNSKDKCGREKAKFFENFEQIRSLREDYEKSFRKIARRLGMNYCTVYGYCKASGELRTESKKT
jgi:DNA invertase Pin-like site-specific DNA recombinase